MFTVLIALLSIVSLVSANPLPAGEGGEHALAKRLSAVKIRSNRDNKCLSPTGAKWTDGTQVTTVDCASAARWDINRGSGSVLLHGSNYALDAVTGSTNNGIVRLWTSQPGAFQQTWYWTDDNRIAISGGTQCLDEGTNGPQTYQCTAGNTNQIWLVYNEV